MFIAYVGREHHGTDDKGGQPPEELPPACRSRARKRAGCDTNGEIDQSDQCVTRAMEPPRWYGHVTIYTTAHANCVLRPPGIPVIASEKVPDAALLVARDILQPKLFERRRTS